LDPVGDTDLALIMSSRSFLLLALALGGAACGPSSGPDGGSADGTGGLGASSTGGAPSGAGGEGLGTGGAGGGVGGTSGSGGSAQTGGTAGAPAEPSPRVRSSFNDGWRFTKGDPQGAPDLSYTQAKQWVLPTGNTFRKDPSDQVTRPSENFAGDVAYVTPAFDASSWQEVTLPHDYAIEGPFTNNVSSSMGRLPSPGTAWYRKTFTVPAEEAGKSLFLDLDGAMQYSMVWVNGEIVGGWPYGYASYRLDLTDYVTPGEENVVAIRVFTPTPDNANWDSGSSRWYPGAGIYRNVWLVSAAPVHVAHWGTQLTTPEVSATSASVDLQVTIDNDGDIDQAIELTTEVLELDADGNAIGEPVVSLEPAALTVPAGGSASAALAGSIPNPKLWNVQPAGEPHLYVARTRLRAGDELLDLYETEFGVRTIEFDGEGFWLNGQDVKMDGVCIHHDLGALGAAVNWRARQRQLEILREMGVNAIRTSHNPFEPELYELADRMGLLIMDEAFDVWTAGKAAHDHHEFFPEWHEQDLRALIRRDRNHPSVVMWSIGNEIVEQSDNVNGPAMGAELTAICHEEDPTRPTVSGMNKAEPESPFSGPIDTIGLNYQGTGVRDLGAQYPTYHDAVPDKFIVGTETTSTFSTRGTYLFPVTSEKGTPATGSSGVDTQNGIVSSYDLYHADWSYSPDEEFESQDKWPYVGGEFVWTGFDYLGEPTPLDSVARSSYFGIVDLAGFKKDRFYLYQAYWRPDLPMAHILPHWTWPSREGQVTPVHVYTSGDSAELFVNDVSQGLKTKGQYEYRLRWDDVTYEAGEVRVLAYKDGQEWATDEIETAGAATGLTLTADGPAIRGDGVDLSFVTLSVVDAEGRLVPAASNAVTFAVSGPGELVATDNGDPTDTQVFSSAQRSAYSGLALAIVRAQPGQSGEIVVTATASGLTQASATIVAE
jgi:beta-galactosidase